MNTVKLTESGVVHAYKQPNDDFPNGVTLCGVQCDINTFVEIKETHKVTCQKCLVQLIKSGDYKVEHKFPKTMVNTVQADGSDIRHLQEEAEGGTDYIPCMGTWAKSTEAWNESPLNVNCPKCLAQMISGGRARLIPAEHTKGPVKPNVDSEVSQPLNKWVVYVTDIGPTLEDVEKLEFEMYLDDPRMVFESGWVGGFLAKHNPDHTLPVYLHNKSTDRFNFFKYQASANELLPVAPPACLKLSHLSKLDITDTTEPVHLIKKTTGSTAWFHCGDFASRTAHREWVGFRKDVTCPACRDASKKIKLSKAKVRKLAEIEDRMTPMGERLFCLWSTGSVNPEYVHGKNLEAALIKAKEGGTPRHCIDRIEEFLPVMRYSRHTEVVFRSEPPVQEEKHRWELYIDKDTIARMCWHSGSATPAVAVKDSTMAHETVMDIRQGTVDVHLLNRTLGQWYKLWVANVWNPCAGPAWEDKSTTYEWEIQCDDESMDWKSPYGNPHMAVSSTPDIASQVEGWKNYDSPIILTNVTDDISYEGVVICSNGDYHNIANSCQLHWEEVD
jgi:hypothetical protein